MKLTSKEQKKLIRSAKKLIEYLWQFEQRHCEECKATEGTARGHIFYTLSALDRLIIKMES
jgi:hypothetical protein